MDSAGTANQGWTAEIEGQRVPAPASAGAAASNLARGKTAAQSSLAYGGAASLAVDGNTDGDFMKGSVSHTGSDREA